MKHLEANKHFDAAEKHIAEGNHKEAWKSINQAQQAASHHARTLAESGENGHRASLTYRKIVMARVGHLASKMNDTPESVNKAIQLSDMQIAKAEALSFVWELMKKDPARFKLLIPQIELAKTVGDIHAIFKMYGFQPLRKAEECEWEELAKKAQDADRAEIVVGNRVYKVPQTPEERDKHWTKIVAASRKAEKLLSEKKKA